MINTRYSQTFFIKQWNIVAEKWNIDAKTNKERLPLLDPEGVCGGLSLVLAEYVRNEKEPEFYYFYYLVCETDPDHIVRILKSKSHEKLIDTGNGLINFIYKIYILQENQENEVWEMPIHFDAKHAEDLIATQNHLRIGNPLIVDGEEKIGVINKLAQLKNKINELDNDESYELGVVDTYHALHSFLVYKINDTFHVFDPNIGIKRSYPTVNGASDAAIESALITYTNGTKRRTSFDDLWNFSKPLAVISLIPFPIWGCVLGYQLYCEEPLSVDEIKLSTPSNLSIAWSKISKSKPPMQKSEVNSPEAKSVKQVSVQVPMIKNWGMRSSPIIRRQSTVRKNGSEIQMSVLKSNAEVEIEAVPLLKGCVS